MEKLVFDFNERLTIRGQGGDLLPTPGGVKECGVLALVALSPERRRTRSFLQDKLWSDRPTEKAQANLRRALSNIRKQLGPHRAKLQSDNRAVWLASSVLVRVSGDAQDPDFLNELTIDDPPEFQDWLRTAVTPPKATLQHRSAPDRAWTPPKACPPASACCRPKACTATPNRRC